MGDQWYYNYNSVNYPPPAQDLNSQFPNSVSVPSQYNQWQQYQNNIAGAPFVPYPPVPSYPPPVTGPYSIPPQPPSIQQTTLGYYNYPQVTQNHSYGVGPPPPPPNDYARELENYKYIKSKITEETKDYKSRER